MADGQKTAHKGVVLGMPMGYSPLPSSGYPKWFL